MNRGVFSGGGRHLEVKNDPVVSGRVRLEERGGRREEGGARREEEAGVLLTQEENWGEGGLVTFRRELLRVCLPGNP